MFIISSPNRPEYSEKTGYKNEFHVKELDEADKKVKDSPEPVLLRAEVFAGQNDFEKARQTLEKARAAHPEQSELWVALGNLSSREGKVEDALRTIADGEAKLGERPEFRLARLQIHMRRPAADARGPRDGRLHHRRVTRQVPLAA